MYMVQQEIDQLMRNGLEQDRLEGLVEILRLTSEILEAEGCILWVQVPSVKEVDPSLFTLAHSFGSEQPYVLHNVSMVHSVAGQVIYSGESHVVRNLTASEYRYDQSRLLKNERIQSFISVPIDFKHQPRGALNIYYGATFDYEPEEKLELAKRIAALIPGLFQSIRERAGFHLLREVNKLFYEAGVAATERGLTDYEMDKVINKVCKTVSESFQAKETTIVLEDEYNNVHGFEVRGTTCKSWIDKSKKGVYQADINDGLTGWCLHHKKTVHIFDLNYFSRDYKDIRKRYPDIRWNDPLEIVKQGKRHFQKRSKKDVPPLSFMVAPILMEGEGILVGAIRCSMATKGPYYFSDQDLELLQLVAVRIGQAWRSWINKRTIEQENKTWARVVDGVQNLDSYVRTCLDEGRLEEDQLYPRVFQTIEEILPGASIMDVRLLDEKRNRLYFKYFAGEAWEYREDGTRRTKDDINSRKKRTFSLDPIDSVGAEVFRTGRVRVINNVNDPVEARYYNKTFSRGQRIIVAPLRAGQQMIGVLDVRSDSIGKFPKQAATIFSLIGQQIGLYYQLNRIFEEQKRTYENLSHQLKTPLDQAFKRSSRALEAARRNQDVEHRLRKIRGLCNKARAVTSSLGLFADLERGKSPSVTLTRHRTDSFIKMLIECAADNQLLTIPRMNLKFEVDRDSFSFLRSQGVKLHYDLYLQAMNNLLENAGKYSYKGTRVMIRGGISENGTSFYTSVLNIGYPITNIDISRCIERGWQGPYANKVTTSGSGIGLWIVDLIMQAHQGVLEIFTTQPGGWNEFRLILPFR